MWYVNYIVLHTLNNVNKIVRIYSLVCKTICFDRTKRARLKFEHSSYYLFSTKITYNEVFVRTSVSYILYILLTYVSSVYKENASKWLIDVLRDQKAELLSCANNLI